MITLRVNGQARSVAAAPDTPLLYVLRNDLGLIAAKLGCGLEQCGSCMVLVDGQTAYACTREVGTVAGRSVTTIESLGTPDKPHPLQQAFLDEQAGQCGYCLSGIIMSAKALLDRNPSPTREDVAEAISGNICRCTGYEPIINAILDAASQRGGQPNGEQGRARV